MREGVTTVSVTGLSMVFHGYNLKLLFATKQRERNSEEQFLKARFIIKNDESNYVFRILLSATLLK